MDNAYAKGYCDGWEDALVAAEKELYGDMNMMGAKIILKRVKKRVDVIGR